MKEGPPACACRASPRPSMRCGVGWMHRPPNIAATHRHQRLRSAHLSVRSRKTAVPTVPRRCRRQPLARWKQGLGCFRPQSVRASSARRALELRRQRPARTAPMPTSPLLPLSSTSQCCRQEPARPRKLHPVQRGRWLPFWRLASAGSSLPQSTAPCSAVVPGVDPHAPPTAVPLPRQACL